MSAPPLYIIPCVTDCSELSFPEPSGADVVGYTSSLIHSGSFNYPCAKTDASGEIDPSDSSCSVCGVTPNVKSYQPYSVSQSFFIRMQNEHRTAMECASYTPDCADPSRGDECGGCLNWSYSSVAKNPIETRYESATVSSQFHGAVNQKQYLEKIKTSQRIIVRGKQLSQSSLLRANRPMKFVNTAGVNKNTAGQLNVMNPYPPSLLNNQNKAVDRGCCTGYTTDFAGVDNYVTGTIADARLSGRDYVPGIDTSGGCCSYTD
jgi:hypothetical protein